MYSAKKSQNLNFFKLPISKYLHFVRLFGLKIICCVVQLHHSGFFSSKKFKLSVSNFRVGLNGSGKISSVI